MWSISRSNQPVTPNSVISTAQAMNAPTACGMVKAPPAAAVANTAAPGVLQAIITGMRSHSEGSSDAKPMPSPSAHIHEAVCAGVAPKAVAA